MGMPVRAEVAEPMSVEKVPLIDLCGAEKVYRTGRLSYAALRGIDLRVEPGEMVSVVGPSGSGKSTALNLITGIDRPTAGTVTVDGQHLDRMNEEELAAWRGRRIGIVFQFFQLLPTLTALVNATLPLDFARIGTNKKRAEVAARNLERVGLGDKLNHVPVELSGGEQQRVAIARALVCEPVLLVGDEPTGNLDTETAHDMFDLLAELNTRGMTILYVTHDRDLAARAHRTVSIRDGRIEDDSAR
jgi:putative ABC transport system ATP-binding protein